MKQYTVTLDSFGKLYTLTVSANNRNDAIYYARLSLANRNVSWTKLTSCAKVQS